MIYCSAIHTTLGSVQSELIIHLFTCLFHKYLLNIYCMTGI